MTDARTLAAAKAIAKADHAKDWDVEAAWAGPLLIEQERAHYLVLAEAALAAADAVDNNKPREST